MPLPVYATVAQFRQLAPSAQAFTNTSDAVINAALSRRSRWFDGFLVRKFTLPLVAWEDDLTGYTIDAAAYDIMTVRGYNPDNGADVSLRLRYEDAASWAKSIPLNTTPMVTDSSGSAIPGQGPTSPRVSSGLQRGFSSRPTQPSQGNPPPGDWVGT